MDDQQEKKSFSENQAKLKDDGVIKTNPKSSPKRQENLIFTIWVHTGYIVLILSMIAWMLVLEFWV